MSIKSYLFSCIILALLFTNCAPSFDIEKERTNIINSLNKLANPEKRVAIFYPDSYNKDSIKNVLKENKDLINSWNTLAERSQVKINNISSAISMQNRLFRIVNATETIKLNLNHYMLSEEELKKYFDNNLIDYVENDKNLTITADLDLIAIYHENNWEYFDFNVSIMYQAYGLVDTKKLIQLYYDEVFVPSEDAWEEESVTEFKKMYYENKDLPQYKDLDFDAYCDCMLKHQEKLDFDREIPEGFYESTTYLNKIFSCRILTTRE